MTRALFSALLALLAAACATRPSVEVHRVPEFAVRAGQPLRIAVLPFRDATPGHGLLWYLGRPFALVGRLVSLNFGSAAPTPAAEAAMMRSLVAARLQDEALAIVNPSQVDASLQALGGRDGQADVVRLAHELDVDAVLDGELNTLSASWFLLVTRRELSGTVRLRSGTDGATLFEARVLVNDSAGIDHGPTGFVSLVAAPLAATDSGPYTEMAIAWAEEVGEALLTSSLQGHGARQPVIDRIAVTARDGPLDAGDVVEVVAEGTPGITAHFDLGSLHREIPMRADGAQQEGVARYRGVYHVRSGDRVDRAPVTVHFVQPGGGLAWRRADRLLDVGRRVASAEASSR